MRATCLVVGLCLTVAGVACGSGSSDRESPAGSAPASTASFAASAAASKAVPHEKLAELLPTIPGFKRESEVQGTTDTDTNVSRVELDYIQDAGGMGGLAVEMMDVATNSVMLAPMKELLKLQGTRQTAAGTTEKATAVAGYPAVEEWTPEASNGSVSILVADRFLVKVTGSSVGKVDVIYKAIEAIDLKKIAALK